MDWIDGWLLVGLGVTAACGPAVTPTSATSDGSTGTGGPATTTDRPATDSDGTTRGSPPADSSTTRTPPTGECRSDQDCRGMEECDTDADDCIEVPHCSPSGHCQECIDATHCPEGWSCYLTECVPWVPPQRCDPPRVDVTVTGMANLDDVDLIDIDGDGDQEVVGFVDDEELMVRLDDGTLATTALEASGRFWDGFGVARLGPEGQPHVIISDAATLMVGELAADGSVQWLPTITAPAGWTERMIGVDFDGDGVDSLVLMGQSTFGNGGFAVVHDLLGAMPDWYESKDLSARDLTVGQLDDIEGPDLLLDAEHSAYWVAGDSFELLASASTKDDSQWVLADLGEPTARAYSLDNLVHEWIGYEQQELGVSISPSARRAVVADPGFAGGPVMLVHGYLDVTMLWNLGDFPDVCRASLAVDPTNSFPTLRAGDIDGDGLDEVVVIQEYTEIHRILAN